MEKSHPQRISNKVIVGKIERFLVSKVISTSEKSTEQASVSKRVYVQNHSYENDFGLHENETAGRTHFHTKGFGFRLVLKQRHKTTGKWPIEEGVRTVGGLEIKNCESSTLEFSTHYVKILLQLPQGSTEEFQVECL